MTFPYSIDPDKKVAYVTYPEQGGLAESLEIIRQLAADERLGVDFGILVDARRVSTLFTAEEARIVASEISKPTLLLSHPIAVIVSRMVQYGMANMISIIASLNGAAFRPFYEVEEAEMWLQTRRQK